MSDKELRIDDLIVQNLDAAKNAVLTAFNVKSSEEIAGWERLIASMRGLPEEAMENIGIPLIQKCFMVFGYDPHSKKGRDAMLPFQDLIALALQDAMQIMMQNMQRSAQTAQALRSGQGGLLK